MWRSAQFVLDSTGLPRRPGTRALTEDVAIFHDRDEFEPQFKRRCNSLNNAANMKGFHVHKDVPPADWQPTLVHVYGPQCKDCIKLKSACDKHPSDTEGMWWQQIHSQIVPDRGLHELKKAALKLEYDRKAEEDGEWRYEWNQARAEQLVLQGEAHLATAERMHPGRPESIEWVSETFGPQISSLEREEGWRRTWAEAYTLLTCCARGAMARAASECDAKEPIRCAVDCGSASLGGTNDSGDYSVSRRLVSELLLERARKQTTTAPLTYAHLYGVLGLVREEHY